jgi:hypothetical protein
MGELLAGTCCWLSVEWEWKEEMRNVFEAILPVENDQFIPTAAPAGSTEKLDVLARRIREGLPLWHPDDRSDYSGLTGAVRPRE